MLATGDLEIRDEFQVRAWFRENQPTHVFVCPGLLGQTSISQFTFTVVGSVNVLMAAMGVAERVRVVAKWPTPEHYLLRRLCELMFFEKQLDYLDIIANGRESMPDFARRAVLAMSDISAKEAHTRREESQQQKREVLEQVVPQRESGQIHQLQECQRQDHSLRRAAEPLLEVPSPHAEGESPRDLRAQCDPPARKEAGRPVHDYSGSVS